MFFFSGECYNSAGQIAHSDVALNLFVPACLGVKFLLPQLALFQYEWKPKFITNFETEAEVNSKWPIWSISVVTQVSQLDEHFISEYARWNC